MLPNQRLEKQGSPETWIIHACGQTVLSEPVPVFGQSGQRHNSIKCQSILCQLVPRPARPADLWSHGRGGGGLFWTVVGNIVCLQPGNYTHKELALRRDVAAQVVVPLLFDVLM